jgi:mannosidase alpha-like ER degradation enhancer 1
MSVAWGEKVHLYAFAGMQVLAGDVTLAENTFAAFFGLWERFGLLPERFALDAGPHGSIHPTEQYYPLRPELMESAFYLYQVCVMPSMPHSFFL